MRLFLCFCTFLLTSLSILQARPLPVFSYFIEDEFDQFIEIQKPTGWFEVAPGNWDAFFADPYQQGRAYGVHTSSGHLFSLNDFTQCLDFFNRLTHGLYPLKYDISLHNEDEVIYYRFVGFDAYNRPSYCQIALASAPTERLYLAVINTSPLGFEEAHQDFLTLNLLQR